MRHMKKGKQTRWAHGKEKQACEVHGKGKADPQGAWEGRRDE